MEGNSPGVLDETASYYLFMQNIKTKSLKPQFLVIVSEIAFPVLAISFIQSKKIFGLMTLGFYESINILVAAGCFATVNFEYSVCGVCKCLASH